jgi:hypothetical protein
VNDGAPELVAELEPGVNRWSDTEAPRDAVLEYTLTATDAVGNESEPSRHARLIPE